MRSAKKLLVALFFIATVTPAAAQVVLLSGDFPDPSVLKDGDDYYMTHSPCHYRPGFLIWHSRDLINWTPVCRACSDWDGSAWAPDLQKVGDTYYIYFPANKTNWVITAKDIRGPWTKPLDLKIEGIDPGLVVTPNGKRFLFTNRGRVTPLSDDGLARAGETVSVYDGWDYPREWETECRCLESPKLTYHDGYYYMTSAEGGTAGPATSHMAVCARSKSVYGPWENSPYNPIVHTYSAAEKWWSKGHGTVVEGPDGQWWIIYHAYRKDAYSLGRHTLMEPIEWTKGGWYRLVKDMDLPQPGPMPELSDDFSSSTIGLLWVGWEEDISQFASVKNGALILPCRGKSPQDGRLMMVTATDSSYVVEVDVRLGKKDSVGGLLLAYNERAFAGVASDGNEFFIYKNALETETCINPFGRSFKIRLENKGGCLNAMVGHDNREWLTIASGIDISDFHHNVYRSFLSLKPSLYASGTGYVQFKSFKYLPSVQE